MAASRSSCQMPICLAAGGLRQAVGRLRGAGGGTRTLTGLPPTDFHTSYGFRRRHTGVCGLDYTFTVAERSALGAARLVSTPSLSGLARDCHLTGFPEFEQFCVPGFPQAHPNDLQVRCVYRSATPAWSEVWPPPSRPSILSFRGATARRLLPMCAPDVPISGKPEIGCGDPESRRPHPLAPQPGFRVRAKTRAPE